MLARRTCTEAMYSTAIRITVKFQATPPLPPRKQDGEAVKQKVSRLSQTMALNQAATKSRRQANDSPLYMETSHKPAHKKSKAAPP